MLIKDATDKKDKKKTFAVPSLHCVQCARRTSGASCIHMCLLHTYIAMAEADRALSQPDTSHVPCTSCDVYIASNRGFSLFLNSEVEIVVSSSTYFSLSSCVERALPIFIIKWIYLYIIVNLLLDLNGRTSNQATQGNHVTSSSYWKMFDFIE